MRSCNRPRQRCSYRIFPPAHRGCHLVATEGASSTLSQRPEPRTRLTRVSCYSLWRRSVPRQAYELISWRPAESRPFLAAPLVGIQYGPIPHKICVAEVPQHRGYHQIARDKPHSFKIRLVGKPRSLSIESPLHDLPRTWPLQLRPFFISIAEVNECEVLHERLNGYKSSESSMSRDICRRSPCWSRCLVPGIGGAG